MAHFTPFIKVTTNVKSTINEAAKDRKIQKNEVDFDILALQTLIQSPEYKEFTIIEEPLEKLFDDETLRSPTLLVRQEYKINIRPYHKDETYKNIHIDIASNKAKSKYIATFKKGSVFPKDPSLAKLLKREINRRKVRLGLLIGHLEPGLNAALLKIAKSVKEDTPLLKDIKIIIAQSPGPVFAVDDGIMLHYEENDEEQRQFVEGVDPDELIFEYIKPKFGKDGRDCKGNYIKVDEPVIKYANYSADQETVKVIEDESSVKYYSIVDGYVKNESGVISIGKEITIEAASFRDTGSIDTGDDKDISVKIANADSSDDAVGSGISIDVKQLNVEGTIGSNANVKANDLSVGEQTHRNSKLEAVENAKIHLHRGNLKAKTAEINILENGTVQADDVNVKKMLGGEVIGHRIVIEELTSNTTIIASESIEIQAITGDNNTLIIDPHRIESYHEKVEANKDEIKDRENKLKEIKEDYAKRLKEHNSQIDRIKTFKKRILEATKAKKTPPKADMLRIKQYKIDTDKLKDETGEIKIKEDKINDVKYELEKLYEADLHGTIKNKSRYNGHTKVIFIDVKTSQEYSMLPDGFYEELHLEKDGNDKKVTW